MIKQTSLRCPKCGSYDVRVNSDDIGSVDNIKKRFTCNSDECDVHTFEVNWQLVGMSIVLNKNGRNVMTSNSKSRFM